MKIETTEEALKTTIRKCQQILATHIEPGSKVSAKKAIGMLLNVLDNRELVKLVQ